MPDAAPALEFRRVSAGYGETVVLEDSYHVITLDRQRDVVLEKTLAFADSLVARSAVGSSSGAVRPVAAA